MAGERRRDTGFHFRDGNNLLHLQYFRGDIFRGRNERFLTSRYLDIAPQERDITLHENAQPAVASVVAATFQTDTRTNTLEIQIHARIHIESGSLRIIDEIVAVPVAVGRPDAARPGDIPRRAR